MIKNGLLIINLGTPSAPDTAAVRNYLRQFLTDKRVIDLPALLRYLLVYCTILPFRPKQSAKAYQAIWTKQGSPLLVYSQRLQAKLQMGLGEQWSVQLGMRYGKPSIATALEELKDCDRLTVLPLYPQYASATTGSSIEQVLSLLAAKTVLPSLTIIRDFYQYAGFIQPQAALIKPHLEHHDYILFSYHGLPKRQLIRVGCSSICPSDCRPIAENNSCCYKAQCFSTTRALVKQLNLQQGQYATAFQSRLGKTPWISPYTDQLLPQLARNGVKRLLICCPSFATDCLETLEEIGLRAQVQWHHLGGEKLTLIPCVNDSDQWVDGIINLTRSSDST